MSRTDAQPNQGVLLPFPFVPAAPMVDEPSGGWPRSDVVSKAADARVVL